VAKRYVFTRRLKVLSVSDAVTLDRKSVPGTQRSDEERAVTSRCTTRRWCDKDRRRRRSQPLSGVHVRHTTQLARQLVY